MTRNIAAINFWLCFVTAVLVWLCPSHVNQNLALATRIVGPVLCCLYFALWWRGPVPKEPKRLPCDWHRSHGFEWLQHCSKCRDNHADN